MPRGFSSTSDAKASLLEASKKWRAEFKSKPATTEVKALSQAVTGALDDLVAAQVHTLDQVKANMEAAANANAGADVANKLATHAAQDLDEIQEKLTEVAKESKEAKAVVEESIRRGKSNLTHIQILQLRDTETVLICRNIESLAQGREETYEEMEAAFKAVMDFMGVEAKVNHIKRLQRVKGDTAKGPATMRVQLSCLGDKIKIFNAIEQLVKKKAKFSFTFHNEIPAYAMNAFKFLSKVAVEVRHMEPDTKTRVAIMKGDHWPTLVVKRQRMGKYKRIDDDAFELARAKYNAKTKEAAERRKASEEARGGRDDDMDTTAPGNSYS